MGNSKVIRGKPEYIYKKSIYLDMPPKTVIKKVVYDSETNTSIVYCKRPSILLEFLCSIIIVVCVLANQLYLHRTTNSIRYNSISYYYDGYLYINVYNDEGNTFDLDVYLYDGDTVVYSNTISPGEYIIRANIDMVKSRYILRFVYRTMFTERIEEVQIMVVTKGEINE